MTYDIYHKTTFEYENDVTFSHNIARLKPRSTYSQEILSFSMDIEPEVYESHEFTDMFGNANMHMLIRKPHKSLSVTGRSRVKLDIEKADKYIDRVRENSISYREALERLSKFHPMDMDAKQFLFASELIPYASEKIKAYAFESFHPKRDLFEATDEFMQRIFHDFEFLSGFSDITTPVEEIFKAKKGVCQDFAQFAISALRTIGLPAKYMSGYIETLPPEGEKKLFGADASHAWFAVYIPNAGWMEFDPTNNIIPMDQHILLGSGRDYHDIAPLKGVVFSSGESELSVMVDVRKVEEEKIQQMQQSQTQQ
jgi:transglutaminase-like putative cysteine protease